MHSALCSSRGCKTAYSWDDQDSCRSQHKIVCACHAQTRQTEQEESYREDREELKDYYNCSPDPYNGRGPEPVEIRQGDVTNIDLPPISWHGYNNCPKVLSVTNTGRTILINGQWTQCRPYLEGGPLSGSYIFSQIHFHCPSEHEIDGKRYPLEMHVVHYKTCYLTQERAMHEKDGTVVLVYLFELTDGNSTALSSITSLAPHLNKVNSREEIPQMSIDSFLRPFTSNYYVYWGSVSTEKNSYLLQWIISCNFLCVTKQEVDGILNVLNSSGFFNLKRMSRMKPENSLIFHVGEEECIAWTSPKPDEKICCCCNKVHGAESFTKCTLAEGVVIPEIHGPPLSSPPHHHQHHPSLGKKGLCLASHKLRRCSHQDLKYKCYARSITSHGSLRDKDKSKKECERSAEEKSTLVCDTGTNMSPISSKSSTCQKHEKAKHPRRSKSSERPAPATSNTATATGSTATVTRKEEEIQTTSEPKSAEKETFSPEEEPFTASPPEHKPLSENTPSDTRTQEIQTSESIIRKPSSGRRRPKCSKSKSPSDKEKEKTKKETEERRKKKKPESKPSKAIKSTEDTQKPSGSGQVVTDSSKEPSKDNIKTLYEKKQQEQEPQNKKDIQVNFLLAPSAAQSAQSNAEVTGSELLEAKETVAPADANFKECPKIPTDVIMNMVSASGVTLPLNKSQSKELRLNMQHVFRSENKDGKVSSTSFQEYHVTIEYDHNVLQEYDGMFHPHRLALGTPEKLKLAAKYQDPKDLQIRLSDCVVKLDSLEQVSLEANFLLKAWGTKKMLSHLDNALRDSPGRPGFITLLDAGTQFELERYLINKAVGTETADEKVEFMKDAQTSHSRIKGFNDQEYQLKRELEDQEYRLKRELEDREYRKKRELEDQEYRIKRVLEDEEYRSKRESVAKRNCEVKLVKNSDSDWVNASNEDQREKFSDDGKGKYEKKCGVRIEEETKHVFPREKKTTYFMYDRIERDASTGKKIFVGSFRTQDEVRSFKKEKRVLENGESVPRTSDKEKTSSNDVAHNSSETIIKVQNWTEERHVSSQDTLSQCIQSPDASRKDVVMLHKFKPKHLDTLSRQTKKDGKHILIGKILHKLYEEGGNLTEVLTSKKTQNGKITAPEMMQGEFDQDGYATTTSSDNENVLKSSGGKILVGFHNQGTPFSAAATAVTATAATASSSTEKIESHESEESSPEEKSQVSFDKKNSQAAIIIVPIEVESLSKIELIIIDHSEDVKKEKKETEYIPCLNCYKQSFSFINLIMLDKEINK